MTFTHIHHRTHTETYSPYVIYYAAFATFYFNPLFFRARILTSESQLLFLHVVQLMYFFSNIFINKMNLFNCLCSVLECSINLAELRVKTHTHLIQLLRLMFKYQLYTDTAE